MLKGMIYMIIKEENEKLEEFDGYYFNPNSTWIDVFNDVITPIIDDHFVAYPNWEDDIDAIINCFMDEYGHYPCVRHACERFFDENYI